MYEEVEVLEPIRRKSGKKLSALEKEWQGMPHSMIRVYVRTSIHRVKTWRISEMVVHRNPPKNSSCQCT